MRNAIEQAPCREILTDKYPLNQSCEKCVTLYLLTMKDCLGLKISIYKSHTDINFGGKKCFNICHDVTHSCLTFYCYTFQ